MVACVACLSEHCDASCWRKRHGNTHAKWGVYVLHQYMRNNIPVFQAIALEDFPDIPEKYLSRFQYLWKTVGWHWNCSTEALSRSLIFYRSYFRLSGDDGGCGKRRPVFGAPVKKRTVFRRVTRMMTWLEGCAVDTDKNWVGDSRVADKMRTQLWANVIRAVSGFAYAEMNAVTMLILAIDVFIPSEWW